MAHVETLQLSLNQCARDKQEWLQERSKLMGDIQTKEFSLTESEAQRSLERSNWQQERERMTKYVQIQVFGARACVRVYACMSVCLYECVRVRVYACTRVRVHLRRRELGSVSRQPRIGKMLLWLSLCR